MKLVSLTYVQVYYISPQLHPPNQKFKRYMDINRLYFVGFRSGHLTSSRLLRHTAGFCVLCEGEGVKNHPAIAGWDVWINFLLVLLQQSAYSTRQIIIIEGFCDVIVRPGNVGNSPAVGIVGGCDDQDGRLGKILICAQ